jgi:hypothetical protein
MPLSCQGQRPSRILVFINEEAFIGDHCSRSDAASVRYVRLAGHLENFG